MRLTDIKDAETRCRLQRRLDAEDAAKRKQTKPMLPQSTRADKQAEKELQNQVENWLYHHGYLRRTPCNITMRPMPARGWQIHLHQAKRNPILLDILLLGNDGRFLEVELKTATGRLAKEQAALIKQGGKLARSFEEFVEIVEEWEG